MFDHYKVAFDAFLETTVMLKAHNFPDVEVYSALCGFFIRITMQAMAGGHLKFDTPETFGECLTGLMRGFMERDAGKGNASA